MHSSYFVLKNKEGKQAEQLVKDYLTDRGYTVQDVSEEQDNYQNDIDFIVQKDGRTSKIEVKLDTRLAKTQNIAFEDAFYLKDKETGQTETREGYYHYSQCDFLIFVSPADNSLYMVHFRKLKENEISLENCFKFVKFYSYTDRCQKRMRIVPVSTLKEKGLLSVFSYQRNITARRGSYNLKMNRRLLHTVKCQCSSLFSYLDIKFS